MKIVKFTLLSAVLLIVGLANAQDITIGSTTLTESEVAVGVQIPWEMLWGPDDHLWVTERRGKVLRIDPETGISTEILDYTSEVASANETGMLGMCLHPDFEVSSKVYIVYTYGGGNFYRDRLVSFDWDGTELINPTTLMEGIHAGYVHAGSRLIITQDEKILMTTGDGGNQNVAQNLNSNGGKTLRINLDGTIPSDNPDPTSYVFSYGHRNQQGLTQAPDGTIYSSEHGASELDEVNILTANSNYGWPIVEGYCDDFPSSSEPDDCGTNDYVEPIFEIRPCGAVNDLVYYNHPAIPELENTLLLSVMRGFSSPSHHRGLFLLKLNDEGTQLETAFDDSSDSDDIILKNKGRVRDVCINPHNGAIYIAVNGASYPSSGPNKIYEYKNELYSSVNEEEKSKALTVFPNPSAGDVKFVVSEHLIGGTYKVISYDGKKVLEGNISSTKFEIKDGELNAGSYYMVATGSKGNISKTFIIQ